MSKDRKSIFVSGHNGFLGSHLVSSLQNKYELCTFDGDLFALPQDFFKGGVDAFFHFAGLSTPAVCEEHPDKAYASNLKLTQDILDKFSETFIQHKTTFVFFSTAHVYGSSSTPLDENSPLNPKSVYARSKLASESFVRDICTYRKIPYIVIRLFNTSHFSQSGPYFMAEMYSQIKNNIADGYPGKELKTGNINVVRDFLALQDFISAMREIADKATAHQTPSGVYNLCSGTGKDLRDILAQLSGQMNVPYRSGNTEPVSAILIGKSDLFQTSFGWKPVYSKDAYTFVQSFLSEIR